MRVLTLAGLVLLLGSPGLSAAAELFDGKQPLLCSTFRLFECDLAGGCVAVAPDELGISGSWTIDFRRKEITSTAANAEPNAIDRVELLDGKLFLSGIQDGLPDQRDGVAWSVSINNPDGVLTVMIAGQGLGIVGLGSCVPR